MQQQCFLTAENRSNSFPILYAADQLLCIHYKNPPTLFPSSAPPSTSINSVIIVTSNLKNGISASKPLNEYSLYIEVHVAYLD